ncbi:unnamed protein product [Allacma fusca]|uniref:Ionotropic glutamate receptor C-terminal domain-containing protein n=1 Tax=Allacma fusca TaxID=39272 RepID=A0A8J2KN56_9HEXA|nr:unnamed protein product [Allacma fusca]
MQENPDYIVILTKHYVPTVPIPYFFLTSSTAAAVIFVQVNAQAYLVCVHCLNLDDVALVVSIPSFDIETISEKYKEMYRNFHSTIVFDGFLSTSKLVCMSRNEVDFYEEKPCALSEISRHLNYTAVYMKNKHVLNKHLTPIPTGRVVVNYIMNSYLDEYLYDRTLQRLYVVVVPGCIFESYNFVWIIDSSIVPTALVDVLDWATWTWICQAIVFTSLGLYIFTWRNQNGQDQKGVIHIFSSAWLLVPFLVEQSQLPKTKCLQRVGVLASSVAMLWSLMVLVISNGYKGVLYSFLTERTSPDVPTTIEGILDTNQFIVTTSAVNVDDVPNSLFHFKLQEYMDFGVGNTRLNKTLHSFYDRLNFANISTTNLALKRGKVANDSQAGNAEFYNHMYIASELDTSLYNLLINSYGSSKMTLPGPIISLFSDRYPLIIEHNFFAPHFVRVLYTLVESGFMQLWKSYSDSWKKLYRFKVLGNFNHTGSREFESKTTKLNLWGLVWNPGRFGQRVDGILTLQILQVVCYVFCAGLSTSVLVFVLEAIVFHIKLKDKKGVLKAQ